jgi:hypothetical protein
MFKTAGPKRPAGVPEAHPWQGFEPTGKRGVRGGFYGYDSYKTKVFCAGQHCSGCMVWKAGKTLSSVTKGEKVTECNAVVMIKFEWNISLLSREAQKFDQILLDIVSPSPSSAKCCDLGT